MGLLRLLLAISVVIGHSGALFGYKQLTGTHAVQAFFVISGFYMALILNEKYIGKNGGYRLFISNRLLRIFPTYWLLLLITIVLSLVWLHHGWHSLEEMVRDITIIGRTDLFVLQDTQRQTLSIPQAWTLVLELMFYIIAPLIVRKSRVVVMLLVISILVRYYTFHCLLIDLLPLPQRFFPSEVVFFLLGALAYFLYKKIQAMSLREAAVRAVAIVAIAIISTYEYLPIDINIHWIHLKDYYYQVLLCLAIPCIFMLSKRSKVDRVLGELSYPVYLSHVAVYTVLTMVLGQKHDTGTFTMWTIGSTIILSLLIVYYFEQPIEKWRQARVKTAESKRDGRTNTARGNKRPLVSEAGVG